MAVNTKTITITYSSKSTIKFILDSDKSLIQISNILPRTHKRYFIFIDSNVDRIWGKQIIDRLQSKDKQIFILVIDPVEESKSLAFYPTVIKFLETNRCSRFDFAIAIGGGIVIDLVSFSVSTFMRGIPLYVIATTIIGQIDAASAGKTCLNTDSGKNTLGTFYYPKIVYNNIQFLNTNTQYFSRQGFSEMFKYGLLGSPELLDLYDKYEMHKTNERLMKLIQLAIESRGKIRKIDPLISNLGHTFGHALEKLSNYKVLHGDAISIGIAISLHYSLEIGIIKKEKVEKIINKMKFHKLNLFIDRNLNIDDMVDTMLRDKKSSPDIINLVLLKNIGSIYRTKKSNFCSVKPLAMKSFLTKFMNTYDYVIDNCWENIKTETIHYV